MPSFIPIDVMNTMPQSGGGGLPEGFYILQITDASESRPEQNRQFSRRLYKTKVLMGPGASQECANRPFTDAIRENDPQWAGRHMELFVACFGSVDAVRGVAQQHGGGVPGEALVGMNYIVQIVKNDKYSNVVQRLPYTQENWDACVGGNGPSAAPRQQAPSPAGGMLVNQQAQQPAFAPPQQPAFQQPPMQQYAPPAQQYSAPQAGGFPPAPGQFAAPPQMPQGGGAPPPPPPPGNPALGK